MSARTVEPRQVDDILFTVHAGLTKARLYDGKYWAGYDKG
jgi:hypothetical protein